VNVPPPKIEPLIVPRASEIRPPLWPRLVALAGAVVVAVILFVVVTARPGDARLYPGAAGQARTTVYLVDNGFHSDLVVPREALFAKPHAAALATAAATDKPWIEIGWGDARFYTQTGGASLSRLASGLRALVFPNNRSVVHIMGLASPPEQVYGGDARPIQLSQAGLEAAIVRVDKSLAMDSGLPQRSDAPRQADEGFFMSVEHFSLAHLCNHWTAELLNAAGLPVTPVLDTLPAGLKWDLARAAK
jgi:uncharacterized protein (TIGR02117 family)